MKVVILITYLTLTTVSARRLLAPSSASSCPCFNSDDAKQDEIVYCNTLENGAGYVEFSSLESSGIEEYFSVITTDASCGTKTGLGFSNLNEDELADCSSIIEEACAAANGNDETKSCPCFDRTDLVDKDVNYCTSGRDYIEFEDESWFVAGPEACRSGSSRIVSAGIAAEDLNKEQASDCLAIVQEACVQKKPEDRCPCFGPVDFLRNDLLRVSSQIIDSAPAGADFGPSNEIDNYWITFRVTNSKVNRCLVYSGKRGGVRAHDNLTPEQRGDCLELLREVEVEYNSTHLCPCFSARPGEAASVCAADAEEDRWNFAHYEDGTYFKVFDNGCRSWNGGDEIHEREHLSKEQEDSCLSIIEDACSNYP